MRGGIFPTELGEDEARALIAAEPPMRGRDLAREVSPREAFTLEPLAGDGPTIAVIDTGVKARSSRTCDCAARDCACTRARERGQLLDEQPDGSSSRTGPVTRRRSPTSSMSCAPSSGACRCSASASVTSCSAAVGLETYKLQSAIAARTTP